MRITLIHFQEYVWLSFTYVTASKSTLQTSSAKKQTNSTEKETSVWYCLEDEAKVLTSIGQSNESKHATKYDH